MGQNHSSRQKRKLLYLYKIFSEQTDSEHGLTVGEIIEKLEELGIHAERKAIYSDIETLCEFGLPIEKHKGKRTIYYVDSHLFETVELELLADAILSSKIFTPRKSRGLIEKLSTLTSWQRGRRLLRKVQLGKRSHGWNEYIYYSIDQIHRAMENNAKINFYYFNYDLSKRRIYRRNRKMYVASPYGLVWDEDKYYLVSYSAKYKHFIHFRVDRMSEVGVAEEKRDPLPPGVDFDEREYLKHMFGMFRGQKEEVTLLFENHMVQAAIERFGEKIEIRRYDREHFVISTEIEISNPFFAWVARYGTCIKILAPAHVMKQYVTYLQDIYSMYVE